MALVKFVRSNDEVEIWINTDLVRTISPAFARGGPSSGQSIISFDQQHEVGVDGSVDQVAVQLTR